jgi:hypothetical protein
MWPGRFDLKPQAEVKTRPENSTDSSRIVHQQVYGFGAGSIHTPISGLF